MTDHKVYLDTKDVMSEIRHRRALYLDIHRRSQSLPKYNQNKACPIFVASEFLRLSSFLLYLDPLIFLNSDRNAPKSFPNPKVQPLIRTLQMKKYTSAQLLMQNAKKIPKFLHLSLAWMFRVLK